MHNFSFDIISKKAFNEIYLNNDITFLNCCVNKAGISINFYQECKENYNLYGIYYYKCKDNIYNFKRKKYA